jgi:hypothetical protein
MLPASMLAAITLSFYFGASQTQPSDLHVTQTARGNDATFHRVAWHGYAFRAPMYYGVRLTYAPANHPQTQIALDYTHFKIYADTTQSVGQSGRWHGAAFTEAAALDQHVQSFEITHGVNLLGIAVLQRVSGSSEDAGAYVGGGPVIYLPHSENRVDGLPGGDGYRFGGGGFEVLGGIRGCINAQPFYAEVKYSHGVPSVPIAQGGAQTRVDAVHEIAGIDVRRCRR